jgi:hypothetical protein
MIILKNSAFFCGCTHQYAVPAPFLQNIKKVLKLPYITSEYHYLFSTKQALLKIIAFWIPYLSELIPYIFAYDKMCATVQEVSTETSLTFHDQDFDESETFPC